MPGPPPKPSALKIAAGNPGNRPLNPAEPKPTGKAVMPEGLPADVAEIWQMYAPRFEKMGLLTDLDVPAFEMLCRAWTAWRSLLAKAQEQGPVVLVNGQPVPNPFLVRADREAQRLSKLLAEFGATPASRSRIQVQDPAAGEGDLDDFLTGAA